MHTPLRRPISAASRLAHLSLYIVHCALCIALAAAAARADALPASAYIQDGLVVQYDGLENVGPGVHANDITAWKDLTGNGHDLPLNANDVVGADRVNIAKASRTASNNVFSAYSPITIEFNARPTEMIAAGNWMASMASISYIGAFGWDARKGAITVMRPQSASATAYNYRTYNSGHNLLSDLISAGVYKTYSACPGYGKKNSANDPVYVNGSLAAKNGSMDWDGGTRSSSLKLSVGSANTASDVRAIRIYSRALTAQEVKINAAVDKVRFDGVELSTALPGYHYNARTGRIVPDDPDKELVIGGTPFEIGESSPAYGTLLDIEAQKSVPCATHAVWTNETGDVAAPCTGWKLYDKDGNVVSNGTGHALAYVHPDPAAYRRLEWQWNVEYLVDDASGDARWVLHDLDVDDGDAPVFTNVVFSGVGGDTLVVTGQVLNVVGSDCAITALTSDVADVPERAVWREAGVIPDGDGGFTITLHTNDTGSAKYLAPGSTVYVTLCAVSGDHVRWLAPQAVAMKAAPAFASSSATASRRTVTFTGRLSNLGMGNATTVALYAGPSTAAEGELEAIGTRITVTSTADSFSFTHTFPAINANYKWQFRATATSAGGTATLETRTAVATVKTLDTTTYTWKTSVSSGNWSDPANWTDNQGGDCAGYPKSAEASAIFPAGTDANVVFTEKLTIGTLNLAAGPTVTFSQGGASTNATKLTATTMTWHNNSSSGGTITLDGVAIASTSGDTLIDTRRALRLVNGANLHFAGIFGQQALNTVVVADGSYLSCNGTYFGGGTLVISNATFWTRSHDYVGRNRTGGHVVFQGERPLWYHSNKSGYFYSAIANANVQLDFLVPAGGYAAAPLRAISTQSYYLGNNGGNAGSCAFTVNVLDESPANFVDGTVTTRLISWPNKGINKNMVLEGHLPAYGAPTDDEFIWGSGTYPTTLDVTINGSSHGAQLQVSCEPALVVSDTLDPAIGYTPLASGDTADCAVPSGYVYVSENTRALCTGWKLYDVNPDTLARTLADCGATTNCSVVGNGGWRDLEWQWRVEYLVTASGAGGTYEPASQWVVAGETATIETTPDAGLYLYAWTTTGPDAVPVSASASFTVTGPAALTASYRGCFWVAPDGDNANDGLTRATAKATLSAAVALASSSTAGDKVVVAGGIYTNMPAASISKPCVVESEHGAGATKFYIAASGTSISVNHADAVLRGITLCSDRKTNVGKTILSVYAGVAKECVVSNIYETSDHPTYLGGGTMEDCTFIHMTASGKPGALRMGYQAANVVRNCRFIGNVTENGGTYGTISLGGGAIYNSLMYCNTNSSGPSAVSHDAGTIDSCTIADNYTRGSYAPAVWSGSGKVTRNTLFFGNRNPYGALDARGSGTYSYCAYGSEVPSGTGNIRLGGDPFANRAAGDYRVLAGPTINAGSSQTWMTGAKDLFGNARVIGSKPDIGCHEASVGSFAVVATAPSSFAVGGDAAITFTAAPSGTNLTGLAYGWLVTDQNGATIASVSGDTTGVLSIPAGYGVFTVSLTAVNAAGETATWTGTATRAPATMYVAKDSTPAFPYDTWETAADTLPTLVPWCGDGTTVVIGDGVYTNTKASVFLNGTTVRSLHGAESTAIFSKTATTTLILGNPQARAEGLTLFSDHVSRGMAAMTIQSGTFADGVVSNFYSSSAQIINLIGQSAILTNSTIIRNETTGRINTIHTNTDGSGSGGGKILNCRIVGNVGNNDTYGCAVFNYNGVLTVRNCLIACNTNKSTGASAVWIRKEAGASIVENCTITENHVGGNTTRASVVLATDATGTFRNCVIHDNHNAANVANWTGTSASFTYCCTTPLPSGTGNVLPIEPMFADGDWRIGAGVCKDAGLNRTWMNGATDLDGGDRIVDDTVDIGCYEYFAGALECLAIPSANLFLDSGEVTIAASVTGPDTTGLSFTWRVTDQTGATIASVADSATATNLVLTLGIGIYDVSLTVRNARGAEASFAAPAMIAVKPQTVYVANGAAQAFPYATHENAFTNILDAVGFAESGMRVVLADGTYTNTANITVAKHVVIESEHGADRTTIFVDNTRFTAWILNASGSALRNVTLLSDNAGGRTPTTKDQRLGAVRVYSGTLDGCVITNWYVYYTSVFSVSGTRAVATNCTVVGCRTYYRTYFSDVSSGGTLTHCRYLRNNSNNGSYSYGSILRVQGSSSNVRNCLFAENTIGSGTDLPEASVVYLADGTVENCTIANNAATDSATTPAAYAAAGTFRNNIVWGNTNKTGATGCTAASASSITYCCAPGLTGTGCQAADPCFRRDYTLGSLSPCIDAGLNRAWMDGATDLGGNPRVRRGYSRGTVDMGCFESLGATGTIIFMK